MDLKIDQLEVQFGWKYFKLTDQSSNKFPLSNIIEFTSNLRDFFYPYSLLKHRLLITG